MPTEVTRDAAGVVFLSLHRNDPAVIGRLPERSRAGSTTVAFDHVLGADASRFEGPIGGFPSAPFTAEHPLHEVFTLFAYLAAITEDLQFLTSVLVLPQRQTALVAKQAAELDILSGGRFRLAVGVGWNERSTSMGATSTLRRPLDAISRVAQLCSQPLVKFDGAAYLDRLGINRFPSDGFRLGARVLPKISARVARVAGVGCLCDAHDISLPRSATFAATWEAKKPPSSSSPWRPIAVNHGDSASAPAGRELRALGVTHLPSSADPARASRSRHVESCSGYTGVPQPPDRDLFRHAAGLRGGYSSS